MSAHQQPPRLLLSGLQTIHPKPTPPHLTPTPLQLDGINLFAILSIISIFYCLPCALVMEGELAPGHMRWCVFGFTPAGCRLQPGNAGASAAGSIMTNSTSALLFLGDRGCSAPALLPCRTRVAAACLHLGPHTPRCRLPIKSPPPPPFAAGPAKWAPMWDAAVAASGGLAAWIKLLVAGGVFYHLYNQASYMVLDQGISPVTFSGARRSR